MFSSIRATRLCTAWHGRSIDLVLQVLLGGASIPAEDGTAVYVDVDVDVDVDVGAGDRLTWMVLQAVLLSLHEVFQRSDNRSVEGCTC